MAITQQRPEPRFRRRTAHDGREHEHGDSADLRLAALAQARTLDRRAQQYNVRCVARGCSEVAPVRFVDACQRDQVKQATRSQLNRP